MSIPLFHLAYNHIILDEIESTNDYANYLIAKSNPKEGTVITTYNQTSGKGQIGRTWFSDQNKNICMSIILKPHFLPIPDSFYLSMIAALAVRETVETFTNTKNVTVKWPNDVFVGNNKIAGLLIQQNLQGNKISSSIIGIGLNVNQQDFPSDLPNPVSLLQITENEEDLFMVQMLVQQNFADLYLLLQQRSYTDIKKLYLAHLFRRGEIVDFIQSDKHLISGEILGVDQSGKLLINSNNEILSFALHEIKMALK